MQTIESLQINTDGGSRSNPGPAAIGVYATQDGNEAFSFSRYLGIATNNEAEYQAVIDALGYLINNQYHVKKITFVLDSELVVRQITGQYKVKQDHLKDLKTKVLEQIENLKKTTKTEEVVFVNVLREKNKEADRLVNEALDSQ